MKVLHITAGLSPEWGGPATAVTNLARALGKRGVECSIFATVGPRAGNEPIFPKGVDVRLFQADFLAHFWTAHAPDLARACEHEVQRYDLAHIHALWHYPHWAAYRAAWKSQVPYVISAHGNLDSWALNHRRWKKRIYSWIVQRRILQQAAALHALTEDEVAQIRSYGITNNVFVIPNGIEADEIGSSPSNDRIVKLFPEIGNKLVVIFLGRLHPKKGLDILVQTFAKVHQSVPRAHLLIVGPDEAGVKEQLQEKVKRLEIDTHVTFTGPLMGADKFSALASARVFVLPSRSEGQSIAVLEAMAVGLPVIVTPACYFPEIVAARAGLVVPLDALDLASAITELLLVPDRAQLMGENARNLVLDKFTWDRVVEAMIGMYGSVVGKTTVRK